MFDGIFSENQLVAFDDVRSVVFLFSPDYARVVLLCRAAWKSFAPLRWTGIGGRLEGEEVTEPATGALRELREETGLALADLREWRFVVDIVDPGAEVRLVYFTAVLDAEQLPPCNEGTLHWVALADYPRYDMIENTRVTLDAILAYDLPHTPERLPWRGGIERDAAGQNPRLIFVPPR
ncbi:MAG TPA: NUDIX domain-containing protein [Ktedonobacterales bacterium]|nr:NUDIX domain-containing protein [Ktedonobacterales bacterium]